MTQSLIWDKLYSRNLHWSGETKEVPTLLENKKVLELGVGNGKTLRAILKQNPREVIALDFSEKAISRCKELIGHNSLSFITADVLKMPIEENSFDAVVCYYTLNNIEQVNQAISEIKRVLKIGGIILFEDFAVGDLRHNITGKSTVIKKDGLYTHYFSKDELISAFKGFKDVKILIKSYIAFKKSVVKRKIIRLQAKK